MRIAKDVEEIGLKVSQDRGLGSSRVAIEAIVRTCWQHYLSGNCLNAPPQDDALSPAPPLLPKTKNRIQGHPPIDAAAALDAVS